MVRIINICSGKGGVGKTVIAANLAAALSSLGKRVAVIDCNITTAHMGLYLGKYAHEKTINSFLKNEAPLSEAVYFHNAGFSFVPAALELNEIMNTEPLDIKQEIEKTFHGHDFVLLDSAPGFGREAMLSIKSSDESLFIAAPFLPSIIDITKCASILRSLGKRNTGIIINMSKNRKYEMKKEDITQFTEMPVIATIREDNEVEKSVNSRKLVFVEKPRAKFSLSVNAVAHFLSGMEYRNKKRFLFF